MRWTRRDLFPLALLAGVPLAAAAGCSGGGDPDASNRRQEADRAGSLAVLYGPAVAPAVAYFRDHHRAHRAALLAGAGNTAPGASATGLPTQPDPMPSGTSQLSAQELAAAERAAILATAQTLAVASPQLAGLLVDINACRVVHCAALDPAAGAQEAGLRVQQRSAMGSGSGSGSSGMVSSADLAAAAESVATTSPQVAAQDPGDLSAAQTILSAEHAAVYAYGALTPHLKGAKRDQAHELYDLHRQLRDGLESSIAAHGAVPVASVAAYAFPRQPTDPDTAATLAEYVESRMAAVCANAATVATSAGRPYAAWAAAQASLRAYEWSGQVVAFPAAFAS